MPEGELFGQQVKPYRTTADASLQALSRVIGNVVVVECEVGDFGHRHPVHAVLLPLLRFEVVGVHERVVGDVDHTAPRMPKDLAKRAELFDRAGVVVTKQVAEHLLGRKQQFFAGFEVATRQEEGPLEGRARASGQQNFQVHAVKAEHDQACGQGDAEVGFFLWKL